MSTFTKFRQLLGPYIALKSISTDYRFLPEIDKTVRWLSDLFRQSGFEVTVKQQGKTNPVVIAKYHQSDLLQTVLVYGHYDVQPAEKSDGWDNDPFVLTESNDRLYGRGVVDNKGQNLIHIVTVIDLIQKGKLARNVIFMLEGNEETSNPDIAALTKANKEMLKCNSIIISDGEIVGNIPTIETSLRGGFNTRVVITSAPNDLHSGLYGGAAPNPALIAAECIASLKDFCGYVHIPGFYEGVKAISYEQQSNLVRMPTDSEVCKMAKLKGLMTEPNISFYGQTGLRPTLEVTGFTAGYTGEGFKNIIPSKAEFRVNFRLVEGQNPETIYENFKRHLATLVPRSVDHEVTGIGFYRAVTLDTSSQQAIQVKGLLKKAYGKEVLTKYVGGGIPIVDDFQSILGIDALLVSLGNEDCNMHGVNENFTINLIEKGLAFSSSYFSLRVK